MRPLKYKAKSHSNIQPKNIILPTFNLISIENYTKPHLSDNRIALNNILLLFKIKGEVEGQKFKNKFSRAELICGLVPLN